MNILITEKDKQMVLSALQFIDDISQRTTSGNLSHNLATIKGISLRNKNFIEKHWINQQSEEIEWISVATRLPEIGKTDFDKKYGWSDKVLIKIDFGYKIDFAFGCYNHTGKSWDVKPFIPGELNVIEWKPLK